MGGIVVHHEQITTMEEDGFQLLSRTRVLCRWRPHASMMYVLLVIELVSAVPMARSWFDDSCVVGEQFLFPLWESADGDNVERVCGWSTDGVQRSGRGVHVRGRPKKIRIRRISTW